MANDVLDQDLLKANIYYGKDVISTLNEYIVKNFKYQKILFFCKSNDYNYINENILSENYEKIIIVLNEFNTDKLEKIAQNIKCDVRALVAYGDFEVAQAVKYFSCKNNLPYIILKNELPIVEELVDYYILYDGVYVAEKCGPPAQILLDSEALKSASRKNICSLVYSLLNKLGYFEDYYLNYIIYKSEFNCNDFLCFKDIYIEIYNLLEKLSMLDSESILRLGDMVLYMSALLKRLNYEVERDKIFVFSNLYLLFTEKKFNSFDFILSGQIGLQVINGIYEKFIKGVENLTFSYIDIEKRVVMFDKYFKNYKLNYNGFELPNIEKLKFVLSRNKNLLSNKIQTLGKLSSKLLSKSFLVQEDSGYALSKDTDSISVVKAVCFCSDIVSGDNFLKIIRDYGVLELYE